MIMKVFPIDCLSWILESNLLEHLRDKTRQLNKQHCNSLSRLSVVQVQHLRFVVLFDKLKCNDFMSATGR